MARLMRFAVACADDLVYSLDVVNVTDAAEMYAAAGTITLRVYPVGTTPEDAIYDYAKLLPLTFGVTIVDGASIAGYPSKVLPADVTFLGNRTGLDFAAFENAEGTYLIVFINQIAPLVDQYRANEIPAFLATVTVGE